LQSLKKLEADIYLIIGADQFEKFNEWKEFQQILNLANLVVTTRPGYDLPEGEDNLPGFLKDHVADFDFNFLELKNGKSVQFITLNDVEVSSTKLRKKLRLGRSAVDMLPLAVESYIQQESLYTYKSEKIKDYLSFTEFCAQVLNEKKGIQIRGYDLQKLETSSSDYTLIASGSSTRHASSLAENLIVAVKEKFALNPQNVEGLQEGRWAVVDYGSVIVHIFYDFVRQEYSIEKLWSKAQEIDLQASLK
ncbi:MAG: ribosome silencing factor, partial [Pseudobdellovibrionaceae bacterium]